MYGKVEVDYIRFAPGLEATQGASHSLPVYKAVSFAPEEESEQWIKIVRKGKRRAKKSFNTNF